MPSVLDAVEPDIRRLLHDTPDMPATVIAERIGWARGLTILRARVREPRAGRTIRHRLNRAGDRQLNRALHTIVLSRLQHYADTRAYAARRRAEGRSDREIKRCLKRFVARRLFRLLEDSAQAA
jgi:hypothetical protein